MKTNKLKNKVKQSDLEFRHDDESTMICNHDGDVLVYIDEKHTGRLDIYYPEQFSLNLYDDIVKYAQTPFDSRKAKPTTFSSSEVNIAAAMRNQVPYDYDENVDLRKTDYRLLFNFYSVNEYTDFLNLLDKVSYSDPVDEE